MRHAKSLMLAVLTAACSGTRDVVPIRLDPGAVIGDEAGAGAMTGWPRVSARHPLGYRVLIPQLTTGGGVPAIYDDAGKFLGALTVPPESAAQFREPLFARFGPGDSLYVFDGARRAFVFTPDRRHVRTVELPVIPWDAVVLADGRLVIASAVHDHPLPLVVLRADGTVEGEIGGSDSIAMRTPSPRRIVLARDGTLWTMPMAGQWRLEHWAADGALLAAIDRTPNWYPPYDGATRDTGRAPRPTLQDAWLDASGRLWVLGKAVDERWKDGMDDDSIAGRPAIDDPDKVSDTMLEVFDGSGSSILATARIDEVYPFAVEPGTLMRVKTRAGESHRAELARIVIDTTRLAPSRP